MSDDDCGHGFKSRDRDVCRACLGDPVRRKLLEASERLRALGVPQLEIDTAAAIALGLLSDRKRANGGGGFVSAPPGTIIADSDATEAVEADKRAQAAYDERSREAEAVYRGAPEKEPHHWRPKCMACGNDEPATIGVRGEPGNWYVRCLKCNQKSDYAQPTIPNNSEPVSGTDDTKPWLPEGALEKLTLDPRTTLVLADGEGGMWTVAALTTLATRLFPKMAQMLRDLEWVDVSPDGSGELPVKACPACALLKPDHAPDCSLAALLRELP